ncbi:peptide deformylase [Fulvivirga ligni]|uniref:peptide deformylase n=1 Tax=Fulvivirga ligni TaxID=2904246 RepID=UPI001F2A204A|nr:peptide deformylase [Fulvivirga ligni]UII20490.1 peptide deformylase [Fulvivirga ligni]
MKRQILAYGNPMLHKKCSEINTFYPDLDKIIEDLWDTMRYANGCGLAASQIDLPLKLFIVDSKSTFDSLDNVDRGVYFEGDHGLQETFINARILSQSKETWNDLEGCLSIPHLSYQISRPWGIEIEYYNRDFEKQIKVFKGLTARMIQHEFDHTEGILYLKYLKPLTRKLMVSKLKKIANGQIDVPYPMKFTK